MLAQTIRSIGFSEAFCVADRTAKENALHELQDYLAHYIAADEVEDAVHRYIDETEGLEGNSTEEILCATLKDAQIAVLERLGFKSYPVSGRG